MMRVFVLGLLISCVPCFASSTFAPQEQKPKVSTQATTAATQKKPQAKPQTHQPHKTVQAKRAPSKKVVVHSQKKHRCPVVIERHYYYENGQPRRVVVRKRVNQHACARQEIHYRKPTRIVRRYEHRQPARVYVAPAPVVSFGYTFH